jgi:anti-anti-sigma factor
MATPLSLSSGRGSDGTPRLVAAGEIDLSNVDTFTQAITTTITEGDGSDALIIDLSAVEYLDSAAINVLAVHADDITRMRLIAHPFLIPVLTISGLTELAEVETAPARPDAQNS